MTTPVGPLTYLLIPNATDLFTVSQGQIKTDFTSIQALIDVDLFDFDSENAGMHMQSTYVDLGNLSIADPTADDFQIIMYATSSSSPTGETELWIDKSNIVNAIPFTAAGFIAGTAAIPGWAILPSGILLKWGEAITAPNGQGVVTLNAADQPTYQACYMALCSPVAIPADTISFVGFTGTSNALFFSGQATVTYTFLVIGLAS